MIESKTKVGNDDKMDGYISKVADYSQKMQDKTILDTMSPDSKEMYVQTLKKQRKEILQKMADAGRDQE